MAAAERTFGGDAVRVGVARGEDDAVVAHHKRRVQHADLVIEQERVAATPAARSRRNRCRCISAVDIRTRPHECKECKNARMAHRMQEPHEWRPVASNDISPHVPGTAHTWLVELRVSPMWQVQYAQLRAIRSGGMRAVSFTGSVSVGVAVRRAGGGCCSLAATFKADTSQAFTLAPLAQCRSSA